VAFSGRWFDTMISLWAQQPQHISEMNPKPRNGGGSAEKGDGRYERVDGGCVAAAMASVRSVPGDKHHHLIHADGRAALDGSRERMRRGGGELRTRNCTSTSSPTAPGGPGVRIMSRGEGGKHRSGTTRGRRRTSAMRRTTPVRCSCQLGVNWPQCGRSAWICEDSPVMFAVS
jgi:hypothetical protein